mmetsp:Transcript_15978/g.30003  ORF Transcript_15978/g.30003 Transcript_15978/m.30003 type:complete len:86 (+) Transcript_15978:930-1187(+)
MCFFFGSCWWCRSRALCDLDLDLALWTRDLDLPPPPLSRAMKSLYSADIAEQSQRTLNFYSDISCILFLGPRTEIKMTAGSICGG